MCMLAAISKDVKRVHEIVFVVTVIVLTEHEVPWINIFGPALDFWLLHCETYGCLQEPTLARIRIDSMIINVELRF